ncbi:MAG: AMP-binding protein, partial [Oscillospiraceae bacterium]|nr:AMP-binding protein [Oscillospiraceae bacterium]
MKAICEYLEEDKIKWAGMPYISVKKDGVFTSRSFDRVISDVENFAAALEAEGLSGSNIMLYSPNSYEWTVISLSVMGYAGTLVPIDKEWTAFDIENAMSSIEISAVFYERSKEEVISAVREKLTKVKFFCINDHFEKFISGGSKIDPKPAGIRDLNSTAMIIFTSGTTNMPKAIPLTQSNLFNNWETLYNRTPMTIADRSYIFLPLNHVYAGVANFLYTIISGMQVFLCSDMSMMIDEMLEIRPTIVCTVPLILNKIYSVMNDEIMKMLKEIRFLYCGGSFTDPAMKKYFIDSGVTLLEAYGTTETSSVIALGIPGDEKIDSAGVIFENLDVRIIDPDENGIGEIIVGGG